MLRTVVAAAKVDGRVSAFIEPIALYMTKDLYEEKTASGRCLPCRELLGGHRYRPHLG